MTKLLTLFSLLLLTACHKQPESNIYVVCYSYNTTDGHDIGYMTLNYYKPLKSFKDIENLGEFVNQSITNRTSSVVITSLTKL